VDGYVNCLDIIMLLYIYNTILYSINIYNYLSLNMKERNKNISKLKFLKLNDTKHTRSSTLTHCCVEFCGCPAPMSPSSMAVAWDAVDCGLLQE
jgi:hypothetical protein